MKNERIKIFFAKNFSKSLLLFIIILVLACGGGFKAKVDINKEYIYWDVGDHFEHHKSFNIYKFKDTLKYKYPTFKDLNKKESEAWCLLNSKTTKIYFNKSLKNVRWRFVGKSNNTSIYGELEKNHIYMFTGLDDINTYYLQIDSLGVSKFYSHSFVNH